MFTRCRCTYRPQP